MHQYVFYLDETGDDDGFPLFGVGGYLFRQERANRMERLWRKTLRRARVPFYHMVEATHANGPFRNLDKVKAVDLHKAIIKLIKAHAEIAVASFAPLDRFAEKEVSPYEFCFENSLLQVNELCRQKHGSDFQIRAYYEGGHKHSGRLAKRFHQLQDLDRNGIMSLCEVTKENSPSVQAADVLVWMLAKYIKDRSRYIRPIRKDIMSLMEVPGSFFHSYPDATGSVYLVQAYNDGIGQAREEALLNGLYNETGDVTQMLKNLPP